MLNVKDLTEFTGRWLRLLRLVWFECVIIKTRWFELAAIRNKWPILAKSNLAPHSSTLETWHYAGAYFRSFKAPKSGMLEVAYHAIRPGQKFDVTMLTTDEYAAHGGDITKTVYHGTSLAAASLIINGSL